MSDEMTLNEVQATLRFNNHIALAEAVESAIAEAAELRTEIANLQKLNTQMHEACEYKDAEIERLKAECERLKALNAANCDRARAESYDRPGTF